ncbi:MAG: phage antirepressor KilAC domain-containing protein [Paraclostridium bifermentans]|uniref:BRO family protein n=1 Tax=Paraclostridium bifermentans TaxID=1490 RepID=UPI00241D3E70|nr:BRO family protein [Paraclostridium bifermentans]MBS5952562.1 phage antirepressor KilAC domain-containing protein [Paraclostridium bifermentans]
MNNLKVFKNQEFGSIRTVEIDGEPWFVAKDISDALEYSKTNKMLNRLDEDEKIHLSKSELQGHQIGGAEINNFGMRLINESGFYNAVIGSNKVEAKKFKKWVTKEVLPSIRKHGAYMTDNVVDMIYNDPQSMIDLLIKLKDEKEARVEAERRNNILMHTNKTYTATEIAKELGFKSATALNKDLCDKGIQYKVNNTYVLYSDYANLGYVSIKQQILDNGKEIYNRHFTQDGRDFILNLYNMQYRVN